MRTEMMFVLLVGFFIKNANQHFHISPPAKMENFESGKEGGGKQYLSVIVIADILGWSEPEAGGQQKMLLWPLGGTPSRHT